MTNVDDSFLSQLAHREGDLRTEGSVEPVLIQRRTDFGDAYTTAAPTAELDQLGYAPNGSRNHALNVAALKLARLPIDRGTLRGELRDACHTNGLIRDDGERSVEKTIDSAFAKADLDGPRTIPERDETPNVVEVDAAILMPASITPNDDEKRDLHQIAVTRRAYDLRVNDEARALWTRQRATLSGQERPALTNLVDLQSQPDEDARYRITDLLPVGGRAPGRPNTMPGRHR